MRGSVVKRLGLLPAVAIAAFLAAAPPASAAGCGERNDVHTSGGEAHWTLGCAGNGISVDGWVKDTDADGQCAEVNAFFPADGSWRSAKACPKGKVQKFTLSGQA
jgi:hypothetical protein